MTFPVYARAAQVYVQAGWPAVIPVPHATKSPPPEGFTGAEGRDTTLNDIAYWVGNGQASHDVALRMPDGVVGIDIDHYITAKGVVKNGGDTWDACVARWGPAPNTWSSTARSNGDPRSRIRFYRVPIGRYRTVIQPHIEIIQRHHRYAVVAPSIHSETGDPYVWYAPDGSVAPDGRVPSIAELAELPPRWVEGLREGATEVAPASAPHAAGEELLARLSLDMRETCSELYDAAARAVAQLDSADPGTRHDEMTARVHRFVMSAAHGHAGFGLAVTGLRELWTRLTAGENREDEFERMLLTSARKAVTAIGGTHELPDPCLIPGSFGTFNVPAPTPIDNREGGEGQALSAPLVDPTPYSWRHVIGVHAFDPTVDLDQLLAYEVLVRCWPMIRYASDTKSSWMQRGPIQWELHERINRRAVTEVAWLMPKGDHTKPAKGEPATKEQRQGARRTRMLTNASASAIANSMQALVTGGFHPSAVRLADLDTNPEILWAGGMPYDLRASREGPAFAQVDPNTPHLVSAGVAPELVSTPYWDALLAAVWPDEALRKWALRVLSIAVTGYADAALPILLGPGGTGKTSTIELIMTVLGSYAHAANVKLLSGEASHDSIIFALKGRRLSFIDEGPREGRWAQERLKQLTGGAALTGNAMNQNPITFKPTHTLILTTNTEPLLTDEAVRRRARLIPCEGDPKAVRKARQALTADIWIREAPGVLARLMQEAAAWLSDQDSALTSAAPVAVQQYVTGLVQDQDVIGQWLADHVEPDAYGTKSHDLYTGFRGWCRDRGLLPGATPGIKVWGVALTERGVPAVHRRDGKYRGLIVRGPSGWTPPPGGPPPAANTDPASDPQAPGSVTGQPADVTGGDGSGFSPVTADKPSSGVVFDTSVTGVTLLPPMKEETTTTTPEPENTSRGSFGVHPSQLIKEATPTRENTPVTGQSDPSQPPRPVTAAAQLLDLIQSSQPVTNSDVARIATEQGISKADARKSLKIEARQRAVEYASGPTVALPAAVDRAGTITPLTYDEARARVQAALARSTALTVDVETSGYPLGHNLYRLRLVQLGDAHEVVVFDAAIDVSVIAELLAGDFPLHAHSATADLSPLAHAGLIDPEQAWERMHDTVIPAKLADPSSTGADPALKKLSPAMLGIESTTMTADAARREVWKAAGWLVDTDADTPVERNGWAQIRHDCQTMIRYAGSDVLDTAAIAVRLAGQLPPQNIYERERLTEHMTARVSLRGLALDVEHIRGLEVKHTAAQAEAAAWIRAQGIENPGSTAQVAQKLAELAVELPRTKPSTKHPDGQPSVAEGVLDPIAQESGPAAELARQLLAYREHTTALGLFLRPYKALCEHGDGRARPTVYTLGTNTGRMSAVRPNIQQLPRAGGFRSMIHADPGQMMISADFSGVELRVAAALSGDPELTRIIADDRDLHMEVARLVWGPDATKANRYVAKRIVFGYLYGGGVPTLAAQGGVTQAVAQRAVDALKSMMPTLASWSDWVRNKVKAGETEFPTYSGRVIHLPAAWPHKAPNYCIQGTAREALVDALVKWNQTKWRTCTLIPVHDELDVFVPAEDAEEATRVLVECMETELYGVKIVAEPSAPSFAWQDSE